MIPAFSNLHLFVFFLQKITDLQLESDDCVSVATGLDNVDSMSATLGFCADISDGKILEAHGVSPH